MQLAIEVAAWSIATVWVVATVASQQHNRLATRIRRLDPLGLVPSWTFFAPNPGTTDHVVLLRDRVGEQWTPWRVAWTEPRHRFRALWRPGRRTAKLITDSTGMWAGQHRRSAEGTEATIPFLLLAAIAERAPHAIGATGFQLALVDVAAQSEGDPVFVHALASPELRLGAQQP